MATNADEALKPKQPAKVATPGDTDAMVPKVGGGLMPTKRPKLTVPKGPTSAPGTEYLSKTPDPAPVAKDYATRYKDAPAQTVGIGKDLPGVSGRLQTLLDTDSPYLDRARTRARQTANRRGLMSSSIAAGAGEAAAIDAALPIAAGDADIAYKARQHRVQQLMQQRGLDQASAEAQAQRELQNILQNRELRVRQLMQTQSLSHDAAQRQADREMQGVLAQFGFDTSAFLQDDRQSFEAEQARLGRGFRREERLGSEAFTAGQTAEDRALTREQAAEQRRFTGEQAGLDRETQRLMQERGITAQEAQAEAQRIFTGEQAALDRQTQQLMQAYGLDRAEAAAEAQRLWAGDEAALNREAARIAQDRGLSSDEAQAALQRELSKNIAVQSAASYAYDQYRLALTAIQNNPNIPAEERDRMIRTAEHARDQQLNLVEQVHNVDLDWTQAQAATAEGG